MIRTFDQNNFGVYGTFGKSVKMKGVIFVVNYVVVGRPLGSGIHLQENHQIYITKKHDHQEYHSQL